MGWPNEWPAVARAIATATDDAVAAALAESSDECDDALSELGALPYEQVVSVHFRIVRELMETLHPDGLAGEDVSDALARCARRSAWTPRLDVPSLAIVLIGALGVGELDDVSAHEPGRVLVASVLAIADLAAAARISVSDYLLSALNDIARAETVEMP
ncbi:hypothetical protein [Antrihabitans sp. YC2-6]|uniref:hypothetical protein n=1 Tax=Antrihabitans sp. YC2-6 TaxID=2799498 RepID=UPI0018F4702C|nr:hypothetical protein [Antrihabitans sp. YC2-6]MBJ8344385.1 hypothetical protein [Antrihabitans sp. YC2-6]